MPEPARPPARRTRSRPRGFNARAWACGRAAAGTEAALADLLGRLDAVGGAETGDFEQLEAAYWLCRRLVDHFERLTEPASSTGQMFLPGVSPEEERNGSSLAEDPPAG